MYRVHAISPHGFSAPSSDRRVNTPAAPTVVTPEPPDVVPPITERANVQDLGDITEQDGPRIILGGLEGAADAAHYYRFTLSEPRSFPPGPALAGERRRLGHRTGRQHGGSG